MRKLTLCLSVGLLGVLLAGCGSSTSGGSNFSCDYKVATVHECFEYDNLPTIDVSAEQTACMGDMGTAGTTCTSTNRLGTCKVTVATLTETYSFYSDGGTTATQAQMQCTALSGTWTNG